MKRVEITETVYKLLAREAGISPGALNEKSNIEKDLSMGIVQLCKAIILIEKTCFVVIENKEIRALKTVEDIILMVEEKQPKEHLVETFRNENDWQPGLPPLNE
jgi:hypothetical protein